MARNAEDAYETRTRPELPSLSYGHPLCTVLPPSSPQTNDTMDVSVERRFPWQQEHIHISRPAFPPLEFAGPAYYLTTEAETDRWCSILSGPMILGFDTEWKPTYIKGEPQNKTALVQLCCRIRREPVCLLMHISCCGISNELRRVMASEEMMKVGMAANGDAEKLRTGYGIDVRGIVDLAKVTPEKDISGCLHQGVQYSKNEKSLLGLTERLLGCTLRKNKKIQCSNWENYPLKPNQQQYAANDAYASLLCYEVLMQLPNKPCKAGKRQKTSSTPHPLAKMPDSDPLHDPSLKTSDVMTTSIEDVESIDYVPPFGFQKRLDGEARLAHRLFMGAEQLHLPKQALTEVAGHLNSSVEHVCMLLADAILAGYAYDWKRITIPIKITARLASDLLRRTSGGREPESEKFEGGHPLSSFNFSLEYSIDRLASLIETVHLSEIAEGVIDFRTILAPMGINMETIIANSDEVVSHGSCRVTVAHIGRRVSDRILKQRM